jgi:hypothetical protein
MDAHRKRILKTKASAASGLLLAGNFSKVCAIRARSGFMASGSRTLPLIPHSVTLHEMFAWMYDGLHDPKKKPILAIRIDTGNG